MPSSYPTTPLLGNSELVHVIRREMEETRQPIPFVRFMELALYHPEWGYYASASGTPGRKGDFYTSLSVGPLFGQILARQFVEMWEHLGRPKKFSIIEQGAMDGQAAVDILSWLKKERSDFFNSVQYLMIEPFSRNRERQKKKLLENDLAAEWAHDLDQIPHEMREGIFWSNELVDSFPVHRVVRREEEWKEVGVTWRENNFGEVDLTITDEKLLKAVHALPLVSGYTTEVHLVAENWMQKAAPVLQKGFFLTIDYGHLQEDYYSEERKPGTLRCFSHHQQNSDYYVRVGQQDMTASVNFSGLIESGKKAQLTPLGWVDQNRFAVGVMADEMKNAEVVSKPLFNAAEQRAWNSLTHPELMGTAFKILVQSKNMADLTLNGLQFARSLFPR